MIPSIEAHFKSPMGLGDFPRGFDCMKVASLRQIDMEQTSIFKAPSALLDFQTPIPSSLNRQSYQKQQFALRFVLGLT